MMKNTTIMRIMADIILLFFVVNGWWVPALLTAIGMTWIFPACIEIFFAGLIFDAIFGENSQSILLGNVATIISLFILLVVNGTKTIIRK